MSSDKKVTKPFVLWLTGLSGAGKSTLAEKVRGHFKSAGAAIEHLDGDVVRDLFPQIGFSKQERDAHIQRIGFLASMLERNGVSVVCSFISPYREARGKVRKQCQNFVEVYVKASLAACEERDVKGLYKRARSGEIKNFTGIDDPYEEPDAPELIVETDVEMVEESFEKIVKWLRGRADEWEM